MNTNNEKWQGSSGRRNATGAREGRENERTRVKTILKGEPIFRSSDVSQERKPRNYSENERPAAYEQRPRFNRYAENNGRDTQGKLIIRKKGEGQEDTRSYRQQGDYQERPYRSNQNGERASYGRRNDTYGGYRPRPQRDGSFDPNAKYSKKKQFEYRQKEVDLTKPVRLNKFLANAGICSRREADDYIQAGVISVNGVIVSELGSKVLPTDKVMFHDQPVRSEKKVYLLLNKPKNCVTTTDDPQERKTVLDLVKHACSERIYPVGRLDRNTTGVLLLTNDGDLAAKLTHPKFGKKKIYHATLDKPLEESDYASIMAGTQLDDETIIPDALEFPKAEEGDRTHIGIEIHSGQNRVVRRIFEKVGYKVIQLDRVFFAGLTKKNLPRGKYRFLNPREVNMLQMGAFE